MILVRLRFQTATVVGLLESVLVASESHFNGSFFYILQSVQSLQGPGY